MTSLHFRPLATTLGLLLSAASLRASGPLPTDVVTYHYDAAVTGHYSHELFLTRTNVASATFGKKFNLAVDGQMYAQPLYVAGLSMGDLGRHNVVFAATEHDSVFAFDADTGTKLWHRTYLGTNPANGTVITSVSHTEVPGQCGQIGPELGITGTPVIDRAGSTIYLVAMTKETSADGSTVEYFQRLHALDLATGQEKPGSPATVEGSFPGTGDGGTVDTFIPLNYKGRPGLVLVNGVVYTSWSSHCDAGTYHGWIMGYDATTLKRVNIYNVTPDGEEASFWAAGAAPGVDAAGNLFVGAANGTFDKQNTDGSMNPSGRDLGESFIRLSTADGHLTPADWFTPYNHADLTSQDLDTGSGGLMLYDVGSAHLAVSAGKEGTLYVLNRDNMGHYTSGADTGAVQTIPRGNAGIGSGFYSCPAFYDSATAGPTLFMAAAGDYTRAFVLDPATGQITGKANSMTSERLNYPGCVPSISSHAGETGILWVLDPAAVLRAYNADNLRTELYNSTQAANSRDDLGSYVKFTTPIIAQGKVYAGTADHVGVYGLLKPEIADDVTSQVAVQVLSTATSNGETVQQVELTNNSGAALTGTVSLVVDALDASATLDNASGTTTLAVPRASFYVNAPLTGGALPAGGSVKVNLKFSPAGGSAPGYTARVLAGGGVR